MFYFKGNFFQNVSVKETVMVSLEYVKCIATYLTKYYCILTIYSYIKLRTTYLKNNNLEILCSKKLLNDTTIA